MKSFKAFFASLLILLSTVASYLSSQELGKVSSETSLGKYFAKTIAYYDNVVLIGEMLRAPSEKNRKYFASLLEKEIKLARFYWESLPSEITSNFARVCLSKKYKSVDELKSDVEYYLAPELIKILDINKEMRALALVTEAERNSFIATKAKSLGISAEKVERIMNSGYVVVPFIKKYLASRDTIVKVVDKKEKRVPAVRVALQGGLTLFRVNFKDNQYSVKPEYEIEDEDESIFEIKDGNIVAAEDTAFMNAVSSIAFKFELTMRNLFKLYSPISEVGFNSVSFPLGRREGIGIDDGFNVIEMVEEPSGEIKPKNVGFVRVTKVDARFSRAQIIIGGILWGKIERGMFVEERPRFPFDFVFGGFLSPVGIEAVKLGLRGQLGNGILREIDNDTLEIISHGKFGYAGRFNVNFNIGRVSRSQISQLWLVLGGGAGIIPLKAKFFGEDVKNATFGWLGLGLMKKFYFRRLALAFESNVVFSNFEFSIKKTDGSDTVKYALSPSLWFFGITAGSGVEFVITPDVNIGGRVYYQATPKSNEWSFLRKVGDKEERRKVKFGNVNLSGFAFQFYVNVSIKNFAKVRRFD